MSQKTLFTKSALAVAVALISTQAWSAGFQLNEFSSSGLGRAYSGEGAIADDAGNVSRNPALITMFDRPTFSAGAVYIDPDVDISGRSDLTGQRADADNIAPTAWVPNLHFVAPINDQFGWGLLLPRTMVWPRNLMITTLLESMAVKPICRRSTLTLAEPTALTIAGVLVLVLMLYTLRQKLSVLPVHSVHCFPNN